ncbi:hypothetical protein [Paenibacillus puerhi]|uniref:hypothetical protein n=1 Tax=Paenibacillus puerhi TaxID=2692622 RepID=UPI001358048C|nr:hypothetical protein [Paenibacillus puerhi]
MNNEEIFLSATLIFTLMGSSTVFAAGSEPNDSFATADPLIYYKLGKISSATDVDYYKLSGAFMSGSYTFKLSVPTLADFDLYLYEKVGSSYLLRKSSTYASSTHESITYNFDSSKEYYFLVKGYNGSTSEYYYILERQ